MFYSHQLLARKAPLGQIWMAATMHAKINRKNLYKLNLIRICEEILNPSIPMALRLSGILMGGVVIVYERKVKLLYDDVTRLLVEINQAWKIKAVSEPTSVSKNKSRTKREAVSRSRNEEETVGEIEQPLPRSNTIDFMQTTFVSMRLDNLEDPVINQEVVEDPPQDRHQVDADNITLFDSFQPDTNVFNHFERFDIEGDDDTQMHFTSLEIPDIQPTVISSPPAIPSPPSIPSPPVHENPQEPEVIIEQHPEVRENQESDQSNKAVPDRVRRGPTRKRARKQATVGLLDYEQIIIPGHVYQSWLQNTTDITSRRKKNKHLDTLPTRKLSNLMELPPLVLAENLFQNGTGMIHYPDQLLDLWMKSTRPLPHDSLSGNSSTPPPAASSVSPVARANVQVPSDNFQGHPVENLRRNQAEDFMPPEILMEDLNNHAQPFDFPVFETDGLEATMANLMTTPGNSGDELRSIPSSGSGPGFPSHNSDVDSGRSNKKRPFSSSKHSGSSLEPVEEENTWRHQDPVFKLAKLTEDGLAVENEILVETGPTQTQIPPIIPQPMDQITHSIKAQLKSHFDAPGCPQAESLNQLTYGMDRKRAACLFYTTCVLANQQCIKVVQKEPYGDILISRGTKM